MRNCVSYVNESCLIYRWVISHMYWSLFIYVHLSHVPQNEAVISNKYVISNKHMPAVTCLIHISFIFVVSDFLIDLLMHWVIFNKYEYIISVISTLRHDASTYETWLIDIWDMTHWHMRHDSLTYETWLSDIWDMTHWHLSHDAFAYGPGVHIWRAMGWLRWVGSLKS